VAGKTSEFGEKKSDNGIRGHDLNGSHSRQYFNDAFSAILLKSESMPSESVDAT
jgi:hypothetical protein